MDVEDGTTAGGANVFGVTKGGQEASVLEGEEYASALLVGGVHLKAVAELTEEIPVSTS